MHERRMFLIFLIAALVVGAVGLVVFFWMGGSGFTRRFAGDDRFASNGERIYFTGTSSRSAIGFSGGPHWFRMHGGGCVVCHGADGRGGAVSMAEDFDAPDIRYKTLSKPHDDEEAMSAPDVKRAITEGKEPDGNTLNSYMPRWDMSDRDLEDVIDFLKKLP